jgi:hypothetical protein
MERIGLRRDPSGDFDHPNVDAVAYPHLVRHVFYRLGRDEWLARKDRAGPPGTVRGASGADEAGG